MICIVVKYGQSFEDAYRLFKKKVQADRILSEVRRRRFFEKPSVIRKRKKAAKLQKPAAELQAESAVAVT